MIMSWHMLCDLCLTRYRTEPVDRRKDLVLLPKCTEKVELWRLSGSAVFGVRKALGVAGMLFKE